MVESRNMGRMERWRTYAPNPLYEVSSHGRVRSWCPRGPVTAMNKHARTARILTPTPDRTGHLYLAIAGVGTRFVHTLVLECFDCPVRSRFTATNVSGLEGRHLDGDPTNNKIENLAWGTRRQNRQDSIQHGTMSRGVHRHNAKLAESQVLSIFTSTEPQKILAARYNVAGSVISRIRTGKSWRWLTEQEFCHGRKAG